MRLLKRLTALKKRQRRLLVHSCWVVLVTRVALWALPVAIVRRLAFISARKSHASLEDIVWSVAVLGRWVPGLNCLVQAIAVQALLAKAGHASRLEIGVSKQATRFEAHAWVDCNNQIVIGGPDVGRYMRLSSWEM